MNILKNQWYMERKRGIFADKDEKLKKSPTNATD